MISFTDIPFSLDLDSLMSQSHVEPGSSDAAGLKALVALAAEIGKPKAGYDVCYISGRTDNTVTVGDITFTSRTLAHNLVSAERVFAFVSTCGHEMDEQFPAKGDMVQAFWWDTIKAQLLGAAESFINEHLHKKFRLEKTAMMRPGSGDASVWPIEQQKDLFALLGAVKEELGVTLTDTCLMMPNKTLSGLLFPTGKDFRSCEVCRRENCPSRSAPFNKELWEQIGSE
jgi:hypothetical protein